MIRRLADGVLAAVLAPACAVCHRPLDSPASGVVCTGCWKSVRSIPPPLCDACGDPWWSCRRTLRNGQCARCAGSGRSITRSRSVGEYEGALRGILHALKYDRRRSIAPILSALMRAHGAPVLEHADCAIPVPLHWRRLWARGFNQAADLAQGLGLPVVHALKRTRATRTQTDLPAAARHANVRHAFAARRRPCLHGSTVVLVDDVTTTGATLEACARVLAEAGAKEVRSLTAARVVTERSAGRRR